MRARNIKPGLFKNEVLGAADPLLTILFEGLWCLADREGRLEDRPLRIKAEVFPYRDSLDIHRCLTDLERMSFIQRYEAELPGEQVHKVKVIQVINFLKHQSPHHTEKKSTLPAPVSSPLINGAYQEQHGEYPPDSLIPDSLIPDSGAPLSEVKGTSDQTDVKPLSCAQSDTAGRNTGGKRGTRLPQDFAVTDTHRAFARENGLPNPDEQLPAFCDYWLAQPGQKGVKADWDATFRNWLRNEAKYRGHRSAKAAHTNIKPVDYAAGAQPQGNGVYQL